MLLKALVITPSIVAITLGLEGDTSIRDTNSQLVTVGQLQEIVNQLTDNNQILKDQINRIGAAKVKLLSTGQFLGEKLKLKGFLIQMHFKVI